MASATSPFLVSVHDLVHRPGELRERELDIPASEKFGEGVAAVAEGTPLEIDLRLEGLHEGILASGEVRTTASGECVRCLDPVDLDVDVRFQELFAYTPSEEFEFTVSDDRIDLEPLVRDAIVLALPFQLLCDPDCFGLDPATGEKRTTAPSEDDAPVDPRWAALDALRREEQ